MTTILATVILLTVILLVVVCRGTNTSESGNVAPSNQSSSVAVDLGSTTTTTPHKLRVQTDKEPVSIEGISTQVVPTQIVPTQIVPTQIVSISSPTPISIVDSNEVLENSSDDLFIPSRDGFGFQNFPGGSQSAEIQIDDLTDFFGIDGLCVNGSGDSCVPYPGVKDFLSLLNEVLANGLCYGFSAAATEFFSESTSLASINETVNKTFQLDRSSDLDHHIARWHMLQFTEEFQQVLDQYYDMSPSDIAEDLIRQLDKPKGKNPPPMTLALYSSKGAHSITPLSVEREGNKYMVSVYDSNWPGQTRDVEITSDGSWSYQGGHADPNDMSDTWQESGPGTMALIPHTLDGSKFRCFFCEKSTEPLSGTGSVLILNSHESEMISITVLDTHGNKLKRGLGENTSEIEGAKSYILPGNVFSGATIMVYIPPALRQFAVSVNANEDTEKEFTLLHAGLRNPTTTLKGRVSLNPEDFPSLRIHIDASEDISTLIDTKAINLIKQASSRSTTFFEPEEGEMYESSFREGLIDDVKVVDKKSGKIKFSLKESIENVDLPLRPITNEDGIGFSRLRNGVPTVEFSDKTKISSIFSGQMSIGFETQYPDGTRGTFAFDEDGQTISSLTDGSSSVRSGNGSLVQSTRNGLLIHIDPQGELGLFFAEESRIISVNHEKAFEDISENPKELIRTFDKFLEEREFNPLGAGGASRSEGDKIPAEKSGGSGVRNDDDRYKEKTRREIPPPVPESTFPESLRQRLLIATKFRENLEESHLKGINSKEMLDQAWENSKHIDGAIDAARDGAYSR